MRDLALGPTGEGGDYLYKLVYDATTQRAWEHWQENKGEVGRPISWELKARWVLPEVHWH
jgi:hypothetical protein